MNNTLQKTNPIEKAMEFIPFGAADKIKLTTQIIQNIVAVPSKSGKTCSERDAVKFMMLCQAQRLNPFAGDAFLIGYDGNNGVASFSLITAHQAFLKRAEACPEYDGMESGVIIQDKDDSIKEVEGDFHLPDQVVLGGWAKVFHRKRSKPTYRRIRLERFDKGFAQWKDDPAGMICKCAEADALRSTFPTLLGGLYIDGEQQRQVIEVNTEAPITPRFNRELKPTTEENGAAERSAAIEAEQPAKPVRKPAAPKQTPQEEVWAKLEASKIMFEDFRDWCGTVGHLKDADSYADMASLPTEICAGLLLTKELDKCIKIYGGGAK